MLYAKLVNIMLYSHPGDFTLGSFIILAEKDKKFCRCASYMLHGTLLAGV